MLEVMCTVAPRYSWFNNSSYDSNPWPYREEAHNLRQQLKRLEDSYEHTSSLLKDKSNTLDEAIKELAENKVCLNIVVAVID